MIVENATGDTRENYFSQNMINLVTY
jgi:hypothetical protein